MNWLLERLYMGRRTPCWLARPVMRWALRRQGTTLEAEVHRLVHNGLRGVAYDFECLVCREVGLPHAHGPV